MYFYTLKFYGGIRKNALIIQKIILVLFESVQNFCLLGCKAATLLLICTKKKALMMRRTWMLAKQLCRCTIYCSRKIIYMYLIVRKRFCSTCVWTYMCLLLHCTHCLQEKSSLSESIANKESQVSTKHVLKPLKWRTILASCKASIVLLIGNTDSVDPFTAKKKIKCYIILPWCFVALL